MPRDFLRQISESKRQLDRIEPTPSDLATLRAQIDATLEGKSPTRRRRLGLGFAVTLATIFAAAIVAVLLLGGPRSWYIIESGASCVETGLALTVKSTCAGPVVARLGRDRVELHKGTVLQQVDGRLRMKRGRARFRITPRRTQDTRFTLELPRGRIEVVGTVFKVKDNGHRGRVAVEKGVIVFIWSDGAGTERLTAGQSLQWPKPPARDETTAEAPPTSQPSLAASRPALAESRPVKTRKKQRRVRRRETKQQKRLLLVMRRMLQLRSQKRYREAVALLARASRRPDLSRAQQARLSYERGRILETPLHDTQAACKHWRVHLKHFAKEESAKYAAAKVRRCDNRSRSGDRGSRSGVGPN